MNKIQLLNNIKILDDKDIQIIIDLNEIEKLDDFIKQIYTGLGCPDNFGLNLNAFFDTIKDTEFWIKRPLNIIIRNFRDLYNKNIELRMLLSDVLIDIIRIRNNRQYNIYILEKY